MKTPKRLRWQCSGIFVASFEHISLLVLTVNFEQVIASWVICFLKHLFAETQIYESRQEKCWIGRFSWMFAVPRQFFLQKEFLLHLLQFMGGDQEDQKPNFWFFYFYFWIVWKTMEFQEKEAKIRTKNLTVEKLCNFVISEPNSVTRQSRVYLSHLNINKTKTVIIMIVIAIIA